MNFARPGCSNVGPAEFADRASRSRVGSGEDGEDGEEEEGEEEADGAPRSALVTRPAGRPAVKRSISFGYQAWRDFKRGPSKAAGRARSATMATQQAPVRPPVGPADGGST